MKLEMFNVPEDEPSYILMTPDNRTSETNVDDLQEIKNQLKEHIKTTGKPFRVDDCDKASFGTKLVRAREPFYKLLGELENDPDLIKLMNDKGYNSVVDFRIVISPNTRKRDNRDLGVDVITSMYSENIHIPEIVKLMHNGSTIHSTDDLYVMKNGLFNIKDEVDGYYFKLLKECANVTARDEAKYQKSLELNSNPYFKFKMTLIGNKQFKKMSAEEIYVELSSTTGAEHEIILNELDEKINKTSEDEKLNNYGDVFKYFNRKYNETKDFFSEQIDVEVKNLIGKKIQEGRDNGNETIKLIDTEKEWVLDAIDSAISNCSESTMLANFQHFYQEALRINLLNDYGIKPNRMTVFDNYTESSEDHANIHLLDDDGEIDLLLSHVLIYACCNTHMDMYRDTYLNPQKPVNYLMLVPIDKTSCLSCDGIRKQIV